MHFTSKLLYILVNHGGNRTGGREDCGSTVVLVSVLAWFAICCSMLHLVALTASVCLTILSNFLVTTPTFFIKFGECISVESVVDASDNDDIKLYKCFHLITVVYEISYADDPSSPLWNPTCPVFVSTFLNALFSALFTVWARFRFSRSSSS